MQIAPSFDEFLATQSYQIPISGFLVNIVITAILAFLLSQVYIRYGTSLSNRRMFAKNFVVIAMTTMFIITVVKSSLALSLGLVGALSIVRFRTAIKEPEELAFIFIVIAIGLGLGADQRDITIVATITIILILLLRDKFIYRSKFDQNLHLTISNIGHNKVDLNQIASILEKHCTSINLKRFEDTYETLESTFLVKFDNFEKLSLVKNELKELSESIKIIFLDYQESY